MKAIILCAGYATRLYPLTLNIPKPLLDIAGKPMIEYILNKLYEIQNLDEIFIITNNKFFDKFNEWLDNYKTNIPIKILNDGTMSNDDRLGAVGDMAFVIEKENIDDDLFIIAGDNFFEFSLQDMFNMFLRTNASIVAGLKLKKEEIAGMLGNIIIDQNNKIIGFEEKPQDPKSDIAASATYLFTKNAIRELMNVKEKEKLDNSGDFVKHLSEKQDVYSFVTKRKWFDIGDKEQLEEVRKWKQS